MINVNINSERHIKLLSLLLQWIVLSSSYIHLLVLYLSIKPSLTPNTCVDNWHRIVICATRDACRIFFFFFYYYFYFSKGRCFNPSVQTCWLETKQMKIKPSLQDCFPTYFLPLNAFCNILEWVNWLVD